MKKRVMILATDGFEQSELFTPLAELQKADITTTVVSPEPGEIRGWKGGEWGKSIAVDKTVNEVEIGDYDALVLSGGQINPDKLRMNERAVAIVRGFDMAGKTIAAICHGPWLLAEAKIIRGKKLTSWPSIRTDLTNAGANVVDQQVVTDGNLITSRNPDDLPAFCAALIAMLEKQLQREDA